MILQVFSVRDAKAEYFNNPFFMRTIGEAMRGFEDYVNNDEPNNPASAHSEDFALYHLGAFNNESGEFMGQIPKLLAQGNELKRVKK